MDCMHRLMPQYVPIIDLDKFIEGLQAFGYSDLQLPKPKKNFDFRSLDAKSILIMNSLS
jgi:hypothetical protein